LYASATAAASAQTVALGAIVSSIRDVAGDPVSGALVVVAGPATREATTNVAGIVTILGLPAGTYSVRVTRSGFTPYGTTAKIGSQADGIKILNLHVTSEDLAEAGNAAAETSTAPTDRGNAPYVAPSVTAALAADIVPAPRVVAPLALPALALEGTRPGETRIELDGIPLAGGAANGAALRFRNALDLTGVSFFEGPALSTPSLDQAIGGIVDYRTAAISKTFTSDFAYGYDSTYGSFEHARSSTTFGPLGVSLDAQSADDGNTSATVKAQLALSRATEIDVAAYQAHAATTEAGTSYANDSPALAVDLRTMLGTGTLQGRTFSSSADTTVQTGAAPSETQDWRTRGFTLDYQVPIGEDLTTIGFDRRSEGYAVDDGAQVVQGISTLRFVTDLQLTRLSRLELGDAISSGTRLSHRNDPQAALSLRTGKDVTLRFAAGSAYETAPDELVAAAGPGVRFDPETSFGYRASIDVATHDGDRVRAAAFEVQRFDSFADLASARSSGVEIGFTRDASPGRLGVDAALDLTRTYAFGSQQPFERTLLAEPSVADLQLAGDPYSKVRFALTYDASAVEVGGGVTLLGANNALSTSAVALADLSLRLRLPPLGDLRFGIENLFRTAIDDPELAPLYPPREITVTFERS
jgi:hypothetical protein